MAETKIKHESIEEREAKGIGRREQTPIASRTGWTPAADRRDPVALIEAQDATREPDLVPVRHGRMLVSPFTFYRGAAAIMAVDLRGTPRAGLTGAAVRGCAPVELRCVRLARADAPVRPQRLRRDVSRAVRVRREALWRRASRWRDATTGSPTQDARASDDGRGRAPIGERWREFAGMRTMDIWYSHLDAKSEILAEAQRMSTG